MQQIHPYSLWIGSAGAVRDLRGLHDAGIRAVVQLAYEEVPITLSREFITFRFPLLDGADNDADLLRLAVDTVTHLLERKFATLLCCQAGMSRSPAIASAALAKFTGETIADCVKRVAAHRVCLIHPKVLVQLQSL